MRQKVTTAEVSAAAVAKETGYSGYSGFIDPLSLLTLKTIIELFNGSKSDDPPLALSIDQLQERLPVVVNNAQLEIFLRRLVGKGILDILTDSQSGETLFTPAFFRAQSDQNKQTSKSQSE